MPTKSYNVFECNICSQSEQLTIIPTRDASGPLGRGPRIGKRYGLGNSEQIEGSGVVKGWKPLWSANSWRKKIQYEPNIRITDQIKTKRDVNKGICKDMNDYLLTSRPIFLSIRIILCQGQR